MPASVYIESSIIIYLTSRPSRDVVKAARQAITSDWWLNSKSQFEVYISALVEDEISGGDPMAAARRLQAFISLPKRSCSPMRLWHQKQSRTTVSGMRCTLQSRLRKESIIFLLGTSSTSITPKQKHSSLVLLKLKAGCLLFSAHPKNSEVTTMMNDPIVDEVRNNGLALAARYNNNIEAICKALREREQTSERMIVNRAPHRLAPKGLDAIAEPVAPVG